MLAPKKMNLEMSFQVSMKTVMKESTSPLKALKEEKWDRMDESNKYEMVEVSSHSFKKIAISNIVTEKWVNYIEKIVIGKVIPDGIERIKNS